MLFYSRLYFSNKTIILFLEKPYLVCTTLILANSNIIMKQKSQTFNLQKQEHESLTSKNKNKNFQPSKIKTRTINFEI
jgi:hypothetical protein